MCLGKAHRVMGTSKRGDGEMVNMAVDWDSPGFKSDSGTAHT